MKEVFQTSGVVEMAHSRQGSFSQTSLAPPPAPDPSLPPTCESCLHQYARVNLQLPAIPKWGLPEATYSLCGGCALIYVTEVDA